MSLLSADEALAIVLAAAPPVRPETAALADALGRVLAAPVEAGRDQPPFRASAMDGWAVRAADLAPGPAALRIVGESAAGRGWPGTLGPGEAVRVFTGAAVPDGADLVVLQEEAVREGDRVRPAPSAGGDHNIRPAGGDFRAGDRLLDAGVRLDPWRLSLAAAAGLGDLLVAARPKVAVLATGEELVRPPGRPGPYQIYESASPALAALVGLWGGRALRLETAGDETEAIAAAVRGVQADLIVTIGGASVGDYDLVKPALEGLGLRIEVPRVAIRPGKPTWFGRLGDGRRVLGLPGNPASALVCAQLFLRPFLMAAQGADPAPRRVLARLDADLAANGPREHLMRATLGSAPDGGLTVAPAADQDSSLVGVFAAADALLRRPARAPAAPAGSVVETLLLERL